METTGPNPHYLMPEPVSASSSSSTSSQPRTTDLESSIPTPIPVYVHVHEHSLNPSSGRRTLRRLSGILIPRRPAPPPPPPPPAPPAPAPALSQPSSGRVVSATVAGVMVRSNQRAASLLTPLLVPIANSHSHPDPLRSHPPSPPPVPLSSIPAVEEGLDRQSSTIPSIIITPPAPSRPLIPADLQSRSRTYLRTARLNLVTSLGEQGRLAQRDALRHRTRPSGRLVQGEPEEVSEGSVLASSAAEMARRARRLNARRRRWREYGRNEVLLGLRTMWKRRVAMLRMSELQDGATGLDSPGDEKTDMELELEPELELESEGDEHEEVSESNSTQTTNLVGGSVISTDSASMPVVDLSFLAEHENGYRSIRYHSHTAPTQEPQVKQPNTAMSTNTTTANTNVNQPSTAGPSIVASGLFPWTSVSQYWRRKVAKHSEPAMTVETVAMTNDLVTEFDDDEEYIYHDMVYAMASEVRPRPAGWRGLK